MAEEYNVQTIMNALKEKTEMDPDQHDGCYELMRETIEAYSKLKDFLVIDYRDLNLVYLTTVGTWKQGVEGKKKTVRESHLLPEDKEYLTMLWDDIWEKACRGEYTNNEMDANGNGSIGLFGTGFFSFQRTTTSVHAQNFIRMCCDILPMTNDNMMYDRAAKVLIASFQGMRAASASMILHCLKPFSFPVLNSNMGRRNVFEVLGVQLNKRDNIETYIDNCRKIKAFRDTNFLYKNYRIFDIAAWKVAEYAKKHEYGKFGNWEILSESVARLNCRGGELVHHLADIPSEIRWFFRVSELRTGARQEVVLVHDGFEYDGYFLRESVVPIEIKLCWDEGFSEEVRASAKTVEEVLLEFNRIEDDRFKVRLMETDQDEELKDRAWLLTWNKNNWQWNGYNTLCEGTKHGGTVVESWACLSSKPQFGDEVFLLKLGDEPRGIVGHGRVIRKQYEKDHFNPEKAAEGKKHKAIDVEFDRLLNYERDKILSQAELVDKCSQQHWSPQGSGIEIKKEVVPTIHKLWEKVTTTRTNQYFDMIKVLSFLNEYSGKHYTVPEKAGEQAEYMSEMKRRGQEARQLFIDFVKNAIKDIAELEYVSCSNWVNQGQVVERYLWIELKKQEWKDYPNSVSVSIEKHDVTPGKGYCISIRSDTKSVSSKTPDYKRQMRLIDCELRDGMAYLSQYKDGDYYYHGKDKEKVKTLCNNGTIRKLEIIEEINNILEHDLAGTILADTEKAIREIYSLYKYVMARTGWWPTLGEYDPGITAEQYEAILRKGYTDHVETLSTIYYLYKMGGSGTCAEVANKYGGSPFKYVGQVNGVMRYVASESKCPVQQRDEKDGDRLWAVLFYGKSQDSDKPGSFAYKLREPLTEAIESMEADGFFDELTGKKQIMNSSFDHNMILYGPPGTGKTYHCAYYAVSICDGRNLQEVKKESYAEVMERFRELKAEGRITFTTFHQSYGYEEFIEGIKPKLNAESETLGYTIEDGVFKEFCKRASAIKIQDSEAHVMKEHPSIWGMLLGGTGMTDLKKRCFTNNEVRLGFTEVVDDDVEGDIVSDSKSSWQAKHMVYDFKNTMEIGDIVVIEKTNTSIDAIGVITGEYKYDKSLNQYPRSRAVKWLVKDIDQDMIPFLPNGRKQLSRFSLFSFDYIGTETISQILNENTAEPVIEVDRETKPYIFIIDEINRGNISKIFGELITLIEDTKRAGAAEAMEAILPYSGETFSVPNNVYILGTMNTADRSIALMDTALRRRFEFVEMMPNSEVLNYWGVGTILAGDEELNVAKMLDVINERIEYLFDREHTIGHAFFKKLADDPSIETLAGIFEKNVIPLLQEYFYEDYEKIQLVLGDNEKEDEYKFILDEKVDQRQIFKGNPDIDLPTKRYVIQHSAFRKVQSYKLIGKDL